MKEQRFRIHGGIPLTGMVAVSGMKNAALPIMAAALLTSGVSVLENVPDIDDVHVFCEVFEQIGVRVTYNQGKMIIDPSGLNTSVAMSEGMRKFRASYYLLGTLLARFGKADIALPGGCAIGERPMDQQVKGFEAMGVTVTMTPDSMHCRSDEPIKGCEVFFDVNTVGATINLMLCASLTRGTTILANAAKEPQVVDVANFLNSMGAFVRGAGTDVIRIRGVKELHGCTYTIVPDPIETGTLMLAAAATKGDVLIEGAIPAHMEAVSVKLLEMGVYVREGGDMIHIRSDGVHRAVRIKTLPYPGYPTDLQQPISALLTTARGTSVITETIFEDRFNHIPEFQKMGAIANIDEMNAVIQGVEMLHGTLVSATDLRAGAALIIAGLMAEGVTEIRNIGFIDRGYVRIEEKLASLGANIQRIEVDID